MGCSQSSLEPSGQPKFSNNFTFKDGSGGQRFTNPPKDQLIYDKPVQLKADDHSNTRNSHQSVEAVVADRKQSPQHAGKREKDKRLNNLQPVSHFRHVTETSRGERGYDRNDLGLFELHMDVRHAGEEYDWEERPTVAPGELWSDMEFPVYLAIRDRNDIDWKRPGDFLDSPCLFSDGATRMDVGQGSVGTCWFLSMVALISDKPALLQRVLIEDDYSIGSNKYDGIFHCKFWRYGEWDDVYIDDNLPVVHSNRFWGAHSTTSRNEVWVALLEKAFAKFHGSYNAVYGGQPGDAYICLTGGVSESIDFKGLQAKPTALFRRVKNALKTGSLVSCVVPEENGNKFGLVGNHAYSLTGTAYVMDHKGKGLYLMRIRNPWGHTEWTGPWSDGSKEWESIPLGSVNHAKADDGEFWIQLGHFLHYFSDLTICSLTPDFDKDGCADSLNHVTCLYGDWLGKSAAGFRRRLDNPRYLLTVTDEGTDDDGCTPMVMQIIQKVKHRKKGKISIRCDIFKVLGMSEEDANPMYVLELRGPNTNMYRLELQVSFRHRLEPGHYVIVPSAIDAGLEKEFMIRLFTPCPVIDIKELGRESIMMSCEKGETLDIDEIDCNLKISQCLFGAWISGVNAGGQIANPTFYANPQVYFTIPNHGREQLVELHLMQEHEEQLDKFPLGIRIYPFVHDANVDQNWLLQNYESCMPNHEGDQGPFVLTNDLCAIYILPPARYLAVIHMDSPEQERKFSLVVKSSCQLDINPRQMF